MSDDLRDVAERLRARRLGTARIRTVSAIAAEHIGSFVPQVRNVERWPYLLQLGRPLAGQAESAVRNRRDLAMLLRDRVTYADDVEAMAEPVLSLAVATKVRFVDEGVAMLSQLAAFAAALDVGTIAIPFRPPTPQTRRSGSTTWPIEHAILTAATAIGTGRYVPPQGRESPLIMFLHNTQNHPINEMRVRLHHEFRSEPGVAGVSIGEPMPSPDGGLNWPVIDASRGGATILRIWERRIVGKKLRIPDDLAGGPSLAGAVDGMFLDHYLMWKAGMGL